MVDRLSFIKVNSLKFVALLALFVWRGFVGPVAAGETTRSQSANHGVQISGPSATTNVSNSDAAIKEHITIVIGGDLGLGGSGQRVDPAGARKHGRLYKFEDVTKRIAPFIDGDINFANLETVVTADNRIAAGSKSFQFKSHPDGVRHLVGIGFNLLSLSNNHANDFGAAGMRDTKRHMYKLLSHGLLAAPGLGLTRREAGGPSRIKIGKSTIRVSALGMGGTPPSGRNPGILSFNSARDFRDALTWLGGEKSDYTILSVHHGRELDVRPPAATIRKLRDRAARQAGVDLIIGHHTHVAAGVQSVGKNLIFYGLGNLLHLGMQNMSKFGRCRDFGLLAKLHLFRTRRGRLQAGAVEMRILENMHFISQPMSPVRSRQRIAVINMLAGELDHNQSGARGVRFRWRADGSGVVCLATTKGLPGPLDKLCKQWAGLPKAQSAPAGSCGLPEIRQTIARERRRKLGLLAPKSKAGNKRRARSIFEQVFGH